MFEKKKKIVEATRWFKTGEHSAVVPYRNPAIDGDTKCKTCKSKMINHGWIDVVNHGHIVCPGDWIIRDGKEFYPCKPERFDKTYRVEKFENEN